MCIRDRLGPIHQGTLERGAKTTSDSYILWPARVGAFSLVMAVSYTHLDVYTRQPYGTAGYNYHKDLLNSWTPENTNTNSPRFQMNDQYSGAMSTRFLTNASFLNIQNINVGYRCV